MTIQPLRKFPLPLPFNYIIPPVNAIPNSSLSTARPTLLLSSPGNARNGSLNKRSSQNQTKQIFSISPHPLPFPRSSRAPSLSLVGSAFLDVSSQRLVFGGRRWSVACHHFYPRFICHCRRITISEEEPWTTPTFLHPSPLFFVIPRHQPLLPFFMQRRPWSIERTYQSKLDSGRSPLFPDTCGRITSTLSKHFTTWVVGLFFPKHVRVAVVLDRPSSLRSFNSIDLV